MRRTLGLLFLLVGLLTSSLIADQPHETLPGFRAENVFEAHGVDNVNLFNGDPGVVVPLGPEYTLGPQFKWQLKAYYSAKVWTMLTCAPDTENSTPVAYVRGDPTLGVGWTLQLGYVVASGGGYLYFSPDGGRHQVAVSGSQGFTKDGSHLRFTVVSSTSFKIEFPDGSVQIFDHPFSPPQPTAGTSPDFRSETVLQRFGMTSVKDSFGNTALAVHYDATFPDEVTSIDLAPATQLRTIQSHWTTFTVSAVTWRVQDYIDFPSPATPRLKVSFAYQAGTFARNNYDLSPSPNPTVCPATGSIKVPELDTMTFTDTSSSFSYTYNFDYFPLPGTETIPVQKQGALQQVTLPTSGRISYDYGATTQSFCEISGGGCGDPEVEFQGAAPLQPLSPCTTKFFAFLDKSIAVTVRQEFDSTSGITSTINYDRAGFIAPGASCPDTNRIIRRTTVRSPGNDSTGPSVYAMRVYFHVGFLSDADDQPQDGGIELDRRYYPGTDTNSPVTPVRTVISCYGDAFYGKGPLCGYRDSTGAIRIYNFNDLPPKQAEVTWFGAAPGPASSTDGGTCSTAFSPNCTKWAGSNLQTTAARYITVTTNSTLPSMPGWTQRVATTNWTPQSGSLWNLELFSSKTVTDSGTSLPPPSSVQTTYSFNPAGNGFLNSYSVSDATYGTLTHTFTADAVWNAVAESTAGTGGVATTNFMDTRTFTTGPTQWFLPLSVQRTAPAGIGWKSFDTVRESNTGLITTSKEPNSALSTGYAYDALGRLKTITPPGSELATNVSYDTAKQTTVTRGTLPAGTRQRLLYDDLGRLSREIRQIAAGQFAVRVHKYDTAGHPYFLSEWKGCTSETGDCLSANPGGTTQSNFDPFGRAQTITKSDGATTTIVLTDGAISFSDTLEAVTVNVNGSNATTTTRKDLFGRIVSVTEPSGDVAYYNADVNGKLTCVKQGGTHVMSDCMSNPGGQYRSFRYDSFGFLRSETTPEKGTVTFGTYDALGNVTSETQPGPLSVARVFDPAGRLQKVTSGGQVYLRNCYDGQTTCIDGVAGFAASNPLGRLTRRYGYNPISNPVSTIQDDFNYSNAAGRLSSRATTVGAGVLGTVTQSWFYNSLGLVTQHNHARPSGATPFVVSTAYGYGLPVTEYINGIPMVKSVTYQPGGAIKNYTTGIGIGMDATTQIDQSSTLMPRPSQISTSVPGVPTPLFDTHLYNYDGASNITCLSQSPNCVTPFDTFTYDLRSRLSKATLSGQAQPQYFCYDLFGNLFQKTFSSTPVTCPGTVWTNNRVPTGGYDGRGNQTTNGGDTYTYDGVDRLLTHTTSGLTTKYLYDGAGERQVKISPMLSWTYTFRDEGERVATEYSDGTSSRDNVYLGNLLLASYANAAVPGNGLVWTYYASDHLGSPRLVTNVTGNVVETRRYWPYGEDVTTPSPFQRVRFASMEQDTEAGPNNNRYNDHARHHAASLGRFLGTDRLQGKSRDPQSWNRYAYARNNPVKLVDANGREFGYPGQQQEVQRVLVTQAIARGNEICIGCGAGGSSLALPTRGGSAGPEGALGTAAVIAGARPVLSLLSAIRVASDAAEKVRAPTKGENPYAAAGREAHTGESYPAGFEREVRLPSGKRMDAYNPETKEVIELKPDNPAAVERGVRQVDQYCAECNEVYGGEHTGRVQTYDQEEYLRKYKFPE